ncbi:MAG TPA: aminotransferase class V-fold PLP-dependent enzyme [bacterium]|nr:aminotransferase class V-fold PLP-dependent enzyme [bacterium]HPQ67078.1 aminotransferase class V-fold PLP-dependent enzyme [bacterium]
MEKRTEKTYLDFAATSFPKPEEVYRAVDRYARRVGVGNDRGLYREGQEAAGVMTRARRAIAGLIEADPGEIVFTSGATESLNTFLLGFLQPGDHVVTTSFEHNAVRRPLEFLRERRGVEVSLLPGSLSTGTDPGELEKSIRPATRLCIVNHVSNSFGSVAPVAEIGAILKEHGGIVFALDAAQSLGTLPFSVRELGVDFLAFPGHKGLLGPTGTGGFFIRRDLVERVLPLKFGGTGIRSAEETFLRDLPYKYEVGTQNTWGLAGLGAGAAWVAERGAATVEEHIRTLTARAVAGLRDLEGIVLYLPGTGLPHGAVSFNLAGLPARDAASVFDRVYGIKVREGLHCAPESHRLAGTCPEGTVRASFGVFTRPEDVDYFLAAAAELAESIPAGVRTGAGDR